MKRYIKADEGNVEQAIIDHFGRSNPGTGCSYIDTNGTYIQLYPEIDVHEDLCYWVEDELGVKVDNPDEEWAVREFGWIRLRKDPSMCLIELPSHRPNESQWRSIQNWLYFVEEGFGPRGTDLYIVICDGEPSGKPYRLGSEYSTEDIMKMLKRYYVSGKLYAATSYKR